MAFLLAEGKRQAWNLDSAIFDPEPERLDLAVLLCPESQKPQLSLDKGPGTVGDICSSVSCDRKVRTKKERRTQGGGQAWGFRATCQASHKSVLLKLKGCPIGQLPLSFLFRGQKIDSVLGSMLYPFK